MTTNGWISFDVVSTNHSLSNTAIPAAAEPNNAVYMWWDDLDVRTQGTIHYYDDVANNRFIVQYTNVPHYGTTTPGVYTFQVILTATGTALVQYLDMQQTLNSATIGIESPDGGTGLQVVFNNTYVHNNLAVLFSRGLQWLTEDPTSGTIPPGDSAKVVVTFNTTGLPGGIYTGTLQFTSNDLTQNPLEIPVRVDVVTGIDETKSGVPGSFDLSQNYPNPFNPTTRIEYSLPEQADVTLRIFDVLGREVSTLFAGPQDAGYYTAEWDGRSGSGAQIASGVYFYRLDASSASGQTFTSLKKMVFMK